MPGHDGHQCQRRDVNAVGPRAGDDGLPETWNDRPADRHEHEGGQEDADCRHDGTSGTADHIADGRCGRKDRAWHHLANDDGFVLSCLVLDSTALLQPTVVAERAKRADASRPGPQWTTFVEEGRDTLTKVITSVAQSDLVSILGVLGSIGL